ncbi:MAG: PilZ domain-containing protein [Holophaga sp.]|nr:PilZ domain-containing protein [Holophaga sp.]
MSSERRNYRRIPGGATVGFQELSFAREPEPATSVYGDISGGGLLLNSPRELPLETLLKLEIRVPGWGRHQNHFGPAAEADLRPLVAVGKVVRVEHLESGEYELGVKFLNVYPDDQAALMKFIDAAAMAEEK